MAGDTPSGSVMAGDTPSGSVMTGDTPSGSEIPGNTPSDAILSEDTPAVDPECARCWWLEGGTGSDKSLMLHLLPTWQDEVMDQKLLK
jgi:hypothetical protein